MLYCPYHKVYASKRHQCDALKLVTITKECKGIVDRLFDLVGTGAGALSASHFVTPVIATECEYYINVYIDLPPKDFPIKLLGDFPVGWVIHTETVSSDHISILVIAYNETFRYDGVKTVNDRVKEIIKEFEYYLDTHYDPQAIKSVLKLMYS
ncbi:hypothetical protein [Clostridium chromiireducens]|uniref:Uncharacterized protein n=1 Tax=Clostridium chromiireducens TaxID=225345 RepID=A0A1V4IZN5_9CLOT|nr:hypothetical protein [Clostridium chromiireducens]OPJ65512.1 hypothetical protein CLCHR_07040 [Clostridium chromiireducens]